MPPTPAGFPMTGRAPFRRFELCVGHLPSNPPFIVTPMTHNEGKTQPAIPNRIVTIPSKPTLEGRCSRY